MEVSTTESTSDDPAAGGDIIRSAAAATEKRIGVGRIWGFALTAGIAAGLISWAGGEFAQNAFKPSLSPMTLLSGDIMMLPTVSSTNFAEFKNATLTFAILGGVTGLAMGFAGGLAGRSLSRGVIVGLGGHLAGILVGDSGIPGLTSILLPQLCGQSQRSDDTDPDPWRYLDEHWRRERIRFCVGHGPGATGPGRHRRCGPRRLFCPDPVFQALSASFFPNALSTGPIASDPPVRLLALLSATVLIAAGAARGTQGHVCPARLRPRPSFATTPSPSG